jgi:hypothetical protein
MMPLLTEKPDYARHTLLKDYISAAYFGIICLFCLYELFYGANYPSAFIVGPIFYALLVSTFFMLVIFFSDTVSSICHFLLIISGAKKFKMDSEKRVLVPEAFFVLAIFSAIISAAVYFGANPESRHELFEGYSLLFLALSVVQIVIASFPFSFLRLGWKAVFGEWGESITYITVFPGIVVLLGILANFVLFGFLAPYAKGLLAFTSGQFSIFVFAVTYALLSAAYFVGIGNLLGHKIRL